MTVNGDEMIGEVQGIGQAAHGGRVSYILQRVDPSAPKPSQQR